MGMNGLDKLIGEYSVSLDDAGRIILPKRLRDILDEEKVWLTRGIDHCLRLYTTEQYNEMLQTTIDITDEFDVTNEILLWRRSGAQPLEVDKQGRIQISALMREWAGLYKDCVVLGQYSYIEIWAEDRYKDYLNASEDDFKAGLKELGAIKKKKRDPGNDTNRSYPCVAGRDDTVSGAEGRV